MVVKDEERILVSHSLPKMLEQVWDFNLHLCDRELAESMQVFV